MLLKLLSTNGERIPCASILIRVGTAPKGADGKPLLFNDVPAEDRIKLGVVVPPPLYSDGRYNTQYC